MCIYIYKVQPYLFSMYNTYDNQSIVSIVFYSWYNAIPTVYAYVHIADDYARAECVQCRGTLTEQSPWTTLHK